MKIFLLFLLAIFFATFCDTSHSLRSLHYSTKKKSEEKNKKNVSSSFVGKASYYAHKFHGKTTANGEKFDMYGLTCAHKTLPFNTILRVTYLKTGKSVLVRVNDRGPFIKGRILDLSLEAAKNIGLFQDGVGDVNVEIFSRNN